MYLLRYLKWPYIIVYKCYKTNLEYLIAKFNHYNGLMPIVFECMFQQDCFRGAIDDMCISIEKYYPEDDSYDNASFDFNLEKEQN